MNQDSDTLCIWWLSQDDCERMAWMMYPPASESMPPEKYHELLDKRQRESVLPAYIESEWYSRYGRAGRGRLWVPPDIELREITFKGPMAGSAIHCGGIVLHMRDAMSVAFLPGFVTNLQLEPLQSKLLGGGG